MLNTLPLMTIPSACPFKKIMKIIDMVQLYARVIDLGCYFHIHEMFIRTRGEGVTQRSVEKYGHINHFQTNTFQYLHPILSHVHPS